MTTPRPDGIHAGPHTSDAGLFGPESVTWRAMAHPATGIGASAAAMIQMLYPPVMYVIDQASHFRENPELRAQRTSDYAITITYGDVAAAEKAGETLRRVHARCKAVDPDSGVSLVADEPHLLVWVHNSLTWALLRAWGIYGLHLTAEEQDRFVTEQKISARLVGADPDAVASTVVELDAYIDSMTPRLALTTPGLWFRDVMVARPEAGGLPAAAIKGLMVQAAVSVMAPHHRELYGFRWSPLKERLVVASARGLLGAAAAKLPVDLAVGQLREHVDTHAFGSRRVKTVTVPEGPPAELVAS